MNKYRAPKIPLLINVLPNLTVLTDKKIDQITIGNDEIISLIWNIIPNNATGSDGISGQMLCDDSNFLKDDKQLIKKYRPISLLPICGKNFEKIIFNKLYSYINANNLIVWFYN